MANFFPLIINPVGNIIQEIPVNDFLDLSESGIANSGDITVSGIISATGNITAGNVAGETGAFTTVTGNGRALTSMNAANIDTGTLSADRLSGTYTITVSGAATTAGTVTTAAQPNITSVGILSSLSITGNTTSGNLLTGGLISATGGVTGASFTGNGRALTSMNAANIDTGTLPAARLSGTYTITVSGSATTAGTVTTAAQPNITSVGTLSSLSVTGNTTSGNFVTAGLVNAGSLQTSGNAIIGGNLVVNGNLKYINVNELTVQDPVIGLGRGPNNTPLTTNDGKDRGTELWYYNTSEQSAFIGYQNSTGKLIAAANASVANDIVTVNSLGSFVAGAVEASTVSASGNIVGGNVAGTTGAFTTVTGNGRALTSMNAANIDTGTLPAARLSGTYTITVSGAATTAGTVTTAAQPNITSVGTLSLLSVSGNTTSGNLLTGGLISAAGTVTGSQFNGSGAGLTSIPAANVTGTLSVNTTGSAASLTTARAINGTNFNGTASITTANWGTARTINGVSVNGSTNYNIPDLRGTNGTTTLATIGAASAVNYLETTNSPTGSAVSLTTNGTDTDIGLTITTKGAGAITIDTGSGLGNIDLKPGTSSLRLYDDDSSNFFRFITNNTTADYDITLPAGNVVLQTGTMATTNTTQTISGAKTFSGSFTISGTTVNLGSSTATHTAQLAYGATVSGSTKTVNIGTGGVAGSTTNINIGSTAGAGSITINQDILNGRANGVGNIGTTTGRFNNIFARASTASYADLAEIYLTDSDYPAGTVVVFGGKKEVTASAQYADSRLAGVISTNPAFVMNDSADGQPIALQGRVPCSVVGNIQPGDLITTSNTPGVATRLDPADWLPGTVLGKALTGYNSEVPGVIEVVVGRV